MPRRESLSNWLNRSVQIKNYCYNSLLLVPFTFVAAVLVAKQLQLMIFMVS